MTTPTWTTRDGRVYEIAWMSSRHLVNTFNLIMRQNGMTRAIIDKSAPVGNLGNLMDEIKARSLWEWGTETQLEEAVNETFEQMCMERAMIDTKVFWPRVIFWYAALQCVRNAFDSIQTSIEQALADPREPNREKLEQLVAKYTEYRLAPRRNDW